MLLDLDENVSVVATKHFFNGLLDVPLYVVLIVLIAVDAVVLCLGAALGTTLDGRETVLLHFNMGLLGAMLTCFIHILVLFYFIGTGKDIRDAIDSDPELKKRYLPWTREQKRRVFPPACLAISLMIVATLMGGEIHSRLIAYDAGVTLPFRQLPAWWVHLFFVVVALLASGYAFYAEVVAVKENRRAIQDINRTLDRTSAREVDADPV